MTLTQVAIVTKQIITITLLASVLGTISFVGYKIWYAYYLASLPPVEEKADTKFGILPFPDFPQSNVSSSNSSYSIDTATGGLPKAGVDPGFERLVKVYFITKTFASLLSPDKSQNLAEKFDIKAEPGILSETSYRFKEADKTLTIDLDTGNFTYVKEATISAQAGLDDDNKLTADFKRQLTGIGVFKPDLETGRAKVSLLKLEGEKLVPTTVRTEAIAARISLWQTPFENTLIFTPQFNQSLINAEVLTSADKIDNYLNLNFTYYPIDTSTFATYPIKSADEALEDLRSGKGLVVIEPQRPNVSITSVYLGYYLSENYSRFLMPVFVFEGPNFVAYVPAITNQFQTQTR